MTTLTLANSSIPVSPARETYNTVRRKYQNLAEKAAGDFSDHFLERFKNMDDLHGQCQQVVLKYLVATAEEAIQDLIARGIADIDDEYFLNHYLVPYYSWDQDFSEIDEKYMEIVLKADELDEYRTSRRESRGRWVGGGFGLGGAIKGAAGAAAANAAIGIVHGVFNLGSKALSAMGDIYKKSKLFNDPHTKSHLVEAVYHLVFNAHFALVDAANDKEPGCLAGGVSKEDTGKAKRLVENITKGRVKREDADRFLLAAFVLDPYEPAPYVLWMDWHGDADEQLETIARYFGVWVVSERKRDDFAKQRAGLDFSSPEACMASLVTLEQYAKKIGYQSFDGVRTELLALADELDRKRRTVNDVVYETQEAAVDARRKFADAQPRTAKNAARAAKEAAAEKTTGMSSQMNNDSILNRGKKRTTAGVLSLLLGGAGIHKFYLGNWGIGIVYLVSCFLIPGVSAVIGIIEAIRFFTLKDVAFNEKYNYHNLKPFEVVW